MVAPQVAAAGISAGAGFLGSALNNKSARAAASQYTYNLMLQKQQQEWEEYMYKNRYQFERADKEAAGLNMLYGLSSAPQVTSGLNSVGASDTSGYSNGKIQQILTGLQIGGELSARKAEIENVKQQTYTEQQNTLLKQYEAIGKQLDNLYKKKELDAYDKRLMLELKETKSRIALNMGKTAESYSNAELSRARTENARGVEREKIEQENIASKRENEYWKKNPLEYGLKKGTEVYGGSTLGTLTNIQTNINKEVLNRIRKRFNRKSGARH